MTNGKAFMGVYKSISTGVHTSACWISKCVSIRVSVWACTLAAVVNGLWSVCGGGKAGALWKECGFRQPCPFLSVRTSQGHCFSWHFTWQRRATPERRVKTIITALPLARCPLAPLHQVCVCMWEFVCARFWASWVRECERVCGSTVGVCVQVPKVCSSGVCWHTTPPDRIFVLYGNNAGNAASWGPDLQGPTPRPHSAHAKLAIGSQWGVEEHS